MSVSAHQLYSFLKRVWRGQPWAPRWPILLPTAWAYRTKTGMDSDPGWHPERLVQPDADGPLNWKVTGHGANQQHGQPVPRKSKVTAKRKTMSKPRNKGQEHGYSEKRKEMIMVHTLQETKKDSLVSDFLVRISAKASCYFIFYPGCLKARLLYIFKNAPFHLSSLEWDVPGDQRAF